MLRREWAGLVAAGALAIGLGAGCGSREHTEFAQLNPGTPVAVRAAQPSLTLAVGAERTVTVAAYDDKDMAVPGVDFTWTVFDSKVASVTKSGADSAVVKGVGAGYTSVTAKYNGMIASVGVTVTADDVAKPLSFASDIETKARNSCACHESMDTGSMASLSNLLSKGYVVAGDPASSSYLTKGSNTAAHGGGDKWLTNKQLVSDWIQQGAKP